jgi:hypothetical protein
MTDTNAAAAIAAIGKAAALADPGGAAGVGGLFDTLTKASDTVNKNTTWFANQSNSVTSQGVGLTSQWVGLGAAGIGAGAAQILAPSFAAIRADETGISILGRKVFDFPFPKLVDRVMGKSEDPMITDIRAKLVGDLGGKTVAAKIGDLGAESVAKRLTTLGDRTKSIEDRAAAGKAKLDVEAKEISRIQADRDPKRVKGPQYNFSQAQIDSLEKSIKLLTEAIGI